MANGRRTARFVSDLGGPGNVVDETCGIRLHPAAPEQYTRDIAAAISTLVTRADLRRSLGEGARQRVADIGLWASKARNLEALCAEVTAQRAGVS